jgi:hypothetical protein
VITGFHTVGLWINRDDEDGGLTRVVSPLVDTDGVARSGERSWG